MKSNQPKIWIIAIVAACLSVAWPVFAVDNIDPTQRQAVITLLDDAANQVEQRQFDRATASLERALRIDGKDAEIWHLLGQVKLYQSQYAQAEAMATKSNALATNNPSLQARNARLLALAQQPGSITHLPSLAAGPYVSDQTGTDSRTIDNTYAPDTYAPDTYTSDTYVPDTYTYAPDIYTPPRTNPNTVPYQAEDRWYQPPYPITGQQGLPQWREPLPADELLGRIVTQLAFELLAREPVPRELTEFGAAREYQPDYLSQLVLQLREAKVNRWEMLDKQARKAHKFAEKQDRKRYKAWAKQAKKNHQRWEKWAHKGKKKKHRD